MVGWAWVSGWRRREGERGWMDGWFIVLVFVTASAHTETSLFLFMNLLKFLHATVDCILNVTIGHSLHKQCYEVLTAFRA